MKALIFVVSLAMIGTVTEAQLKRMIGTIQPSEAIEKTLDGCACRLSSASLENGFVVVSTMDGERAWMMLSGKLTELSMTKTTESETHGTSFLREYQSPAYSVTVSIVRAKSQAKAQGESEGYSIVAQITVRKGNMVEEVSAAGSCGC